LDSTATLLATDGAGHNMLAINATGNVIGLNLYPGTNVSGNNAEAHRLMANALTGSFAVPEPSTLILLVTGAFGLIAGGWRRRR